MKSDSTTSHYSTEYSTPSPEVGFYVCQEASHLILLQFIFFFGAERSADDLILIFFNQDGQQRMCWRDFKLPGGKAMEDAVVTTDWILYKLEGVAQSVCEGTFKQEELDKLKRVRGSGHTNQGG